MGPSWHIVEYRGREGQEQLEADWRRLYAAMPLRTGFQAYEAHVAYFRLLMAAPERFRCLALRDADGIRAICPLEARVERVLGPPIPVWAVPRHPHFRVSDVICPEDDARRELLPALLDYLRHRPEGRPLLVLGPLPAESVLWEGLQRLPGSCYYTRATVPAAVWDCEQSFDELSSRLTSHFRGRLRQLSRKLDALGGVCFTTVTEAGDLPGALDVFFQVEASGWKGQSGTGSAIQLHPELVAFYRALASAMGSQGADDGCEINSLYADGRCIASQFCLRTGGEYSIPKIAYDEEYSRLSPGLLLFGQTLERCCKDNEIRRLNFLTSPAWMNVWHPDLLAMQEAHLAIGPLSGRSLIALLRFRFGPLRELVHWLGLRRGTAERARER
jgi:Acetyltransferase (GNAT) domain